MKVLLVDDETHSTEYLQTLLIRQGLSPQLITQCNDSSHAVGLIQSGDFDLVFMDVEMPFMSGFDVLSHLGDREFRLVFTTAYDKYALKAIKFSALDYLLKPIDPEELKTTLNKLDQFRSHSKKKQIESLLQNLKGSDFSRLAVSSSEGLDFLSLDEIIRCESDGNYTSVHLVKSKRIVASRTLKEFENLLTEAGFVRIHHKHLINLAHLKKYNKGEGGTVVLSDGSELEVSRRRRDDFLKRLKW